MPSLIARLFAQKVAPPSPRRPRPRFRPACEPLEARDVPSVATIYWQGGDPAGPNDAADPYNWVSGEPGHYLPAPGDLVVFAPNTGGLLDAEGEYIPAGVYNCEGFGGGPYGSITIPDAYTGQVTLGLSIDVGVFDMGGSAWGVQDPPEPGPGGVLDQNGLDVTVTQNFAWVNGTINVPGHLANLNLDGAIGWIAPVGEGAVSLGSSIIETNGAVLTLYAGTVTATNEDLEFAVNEDCEMNVDPGENKITSFGRVVWGPSNVHVGQNARLTVESGDWPTNWTLTNSGTFTLMEGTSAAFFGHVGGQQGAPSYLQSNGATKLYNDSILDLDSGMKMTGGILATIATVGGANASIEGDLTVTGGNIYIGYQSSPHAYGTLSVAGDVTWTGGTYRPVVQGDLDDGPADLWYATGTFTVGQNAVLAPGSLDGEDNETPPTTANWTWLILQGDGGITLQNNVLPQGQGGWWVLDPVAGNPVTQWRIKST